MNAATTAYSRVLLGVLLGLFLAFLPWCAPRRSLSGSESTPLMHERVRLLPLVDSTAIDQSAAWPDSPEHRTILRSHIDQIHTEIERAFRGYEKRGLYRVVSEREGPTVTVGVVLGEAEVENGELCIPVTARVFWLVHQTDLECHFRACSGPVAFESDSASVERLAAQLLKLRMHFPADTLVQTLFGECAAVRR